MTFEHNSARKNVFLSAYRCWHASTLVGETDQKFQFGAISGCGDSYLESIFCPTKYLDYMQNNRMLLEQCNHIVEKDLGTVKSLV